MYLQVWPPSIAKPDKVVHDIERMFESITLTKLRLDSGIQGVLNSYYNLHRVHQRIHGTSPVPHHTLEKAG